MIIVLLRNLDSLIFVINWISYCLKIKKLKFHDLKLQKLGNYFNNVICISVYNRLPSLIYRGLIYRKKTAYSLSGVVQADPQTQQKSNVINYKHQYIR